MESENRFEVQLQHRILLLGLTVLFAWLTHVVAMLPIASKIIELLMHKQLNVVSTWGQWTFQLGEEQTIIIAPWLAFGFIDVFIGFTLALVVSLVLPESLGFMKLKLARELDLVRKRIKTQTNISTDAELNQWFSWSRNDVEAEGERRNFQDNVISEIIDASEALRWYKKNMISQIWIFPAIRLYMSHHFTLKYANNVQGAAYMGAANLIIFIGIRGLKFIPAEQPSPILFALFIEFSLLVLLGITLIYTEEEERLDKILKELKERTTEQAQRMVTLNEQSTMQTQALVNVVRILSGVNTEEVSRSAQTRAGELLSRAVAEGRVDRAVKDAADDALSEAYRNRQQR